ncbi:MAG: lipocalin-like domain-containing protein [Acidobacteriota bacterium]
MMPSTTPPVSVHPESRRATGTRHARRAALGLLGGAILVGLAVLGCGLPQSRTDAIDPPAVGSAVEALGARADAPPDPRFARAFEPRAFVFPHDHGPHPDFQTEWWYFTGNLEATDGRRFGFQWTIFRRALRPPGPSTPGDSTPGDSSPGDSTPGDSSQAASSAASSSAWSTRQLYMGHVALVDVAADRHVAAERFARGAVGLAGAVADPFRVWLEDWEAATVDSATENAALETAGLQNDLAARTLFPLRLRAAEGDMAFDLEIRAAKPHVLQGEKGLSRKSDLPGGASYYLSFTRLLASGRVQVDGEEWIEVEGTAWLDREWSTSVLAPEQTGWDWFALQLDAGPEGLDRDVMVYQLRLDADDDQPQVDDASKGILVDAAGAGTVLAHHDFTLEVLEHWRSPTSGIRYPVRWRLQLPAHDLDLDIAAVVDDQELDISFRYWEGAVDVRPWTEREGPAIGRGYVELVGYT